MDDKMQTRDLENRIDAIVERYHQCELESEPEPEVETPTIDPFKFIYALADRLKNETVYVCQHSAACQHDDHFNCDCDSDDFAQASNWKLIELSGTKMQLTCHVDAAVRCDKKNDLRFFLLDVSDEDVLFDITWSQRQLTVYSGTDTVGYAMTDPPACQFGYMVTTFDTMQFQHATK